MSIARCQEINARLRALGFVVHEMPGCWSRGNGQSPAYEGGLVHHTATAFGMCLPGTGIYNLLANGRPDLAGPLCQYAGNEDSSLSFVAAFPANHAGASGGRSMGPLPNTTLFNRRVLGLEVIYPGTVPMRPAQYSAALAWSRVVTDVCGYSDIQRGRAHAETSITGKWDPGYANGKTIDMATFRRDAASISSPSQQQGEDMLTPDDGNTRWASVNIYTGDVEKKPVADWLGETNAIARHAVDLLGPLDTDLRNDSAVKQELLVKILAAVTGDVIDPAELSARLEAVAREAAQAGVQAAEVAVRQVVNGTVLPALAQLQAALAADNADEAKAVVDELAARLRPAA